MVIGAWWLAEDGGLRQRIVTIGSDVLDRAGGSRPAPSWGDVADRVGDFATEERGLRETIGSLGTGAGEDEAGEPAAAE